MNIFQKMRAQWPSSIVAQTEIGKFTGGLIHPRTFANLCSRGEGPVGKHKLGRKNFFDVDTVLEWLSSRSTCEDGGACDENYE